MPKSNGTEPEIIPPEQQHEYDADGLSPKEFLMAIMRDKRLPLAARMEAATKVAVYEHPRLAQTQQDLTAGVKITIEGGLPALPGTNIKMPEPKSPKTNGSGNGDVS